MQDTHFVYTQLPFLSRLQRPITLHKKQAVLEGLGDHALVKPVVLLPFHREKGKELKQLSANKDHKHRSIQPYSQNVHSDTSAAPGHETALWSRIPNFSLFSYTGRERKRVAIPARYLCFSISWTLCWRDIRFLRPSWVLHILSNLMDLYRRKTGWNTTTGPLGVCMSLCDCSYTY